MNNMEIITLVTNIIIAISAVSTAYAAIHALRTWKREIKAKSKFEAARDILSSTYKLRDALASARSPAIKVAEATRVHIEPIYQIRLEQVLRAFNEFQNQTYRAEALTDENFTSVCNEFSNHIKTLNHAFNEDLKNIDSAGEYFKEMGSKGTSEQVSFA